MNRFAKILFLASLLAPTSPFAATVERLENGKEIYVAYCNVCHGDKGDGNTFVKNAIKVPPADFTDKLNFPRFTIERMRQVILHGRPGTAMPAWLHDLTAEQIDDVILYIRKVFMGVDEEPTSP